MDQTQNGEAQTPTRDPMTTAKLVGEVVHAFTAHGMAVEKDLEQAQQGARTLGLQLRIAHRAMDENERRIGKLQDTVKARDDLLHEMWALLCNSMADVSLPNDGGWAQRFAELRDRYHATLGTQPAQTDAGPTEGDAGTQGHPAPTSAG